MGVPHKRRSSILQGEGGDAIGDGGASAPPRWRLSIRPQQARSQVGDCRDVLLECQFGAIFLNGCTEEFGLAQGNRKKYAGCACRAAAPLLPVA